MSQGRTVFKRFGEKFAFNQEEKPFFVFGFQKLKNQFSFEIYENASELSSIA